MKTVRCLVCGRQRQRSETMPICPKGDDDKILGRICREGDCPRRCVVIHDKAGYRVQARAAQGEGE